MRLTDKQVARADDVLLDQNYRLDHRTLAVQEWRKDCGHTIYLHLDRSPYAVLVHPDLLTAELSDIPGVALDTHDPVFSSNLRKYPKRPNTGRKPERCGHQLLMSENSIEESLPELLRVHRHGHYVEGAD